MWHFLTNNNWYDKIFEKYLEIFRNISPKVLPGPGSEWGRSNSRGPPQPCSPCCRVRSRSENQQNYLWWNSDARTVYGTEDFFCEELFCVRKFLLYKAKWRFTRNSKLLETICYYECSHLVISPTTLLFVLNGVHVVQDDCTVLVAPAVKYLVLT